MPPQCAYFASLNQTRPQRPTSSLIGTAAVGLQGAAPIWKGHSGLSRALTALARARAKALEYHLGEHVAEMEIPNSVAFLQSQTGHIDLENASSADLLRYIIVMHPVNPEARVGI